MTRSSGGRTRRPPARRGRSRCGSFARPRRRTRRSGARCDGAPRPACRGVRRAGIAARRAGVAGGLASSASWASRRGRMRCSNASRSCLMRSWTIATAWGSTAWTRAGSMALSRSLGRGMVRDVGGGEERVEVLDVRAAAAVWKAHGEPAVEHGLALEVGDQPREDHDDLAWLQGPWPARRAARCVARTRRASDPRPTRRSGAVATGSARSATRTPRGARRRSPFAWRRDRRSAPRDPFSWPRPGARAGAFGGGGSDRAGSPEARYDRRKSPCIRAGVEIPAATLAKTPQADEPDRIGAAPTAARGARHDAAAVRRDGGAGASSRRAQDERAFGLSARLQRQRHRHRRPSDEGRCHASRRGSRRSSRPTRAADAKGREVFAHLAAVHATWIEELLGGLDPHEAAELTTQLDRLEKT